MRIVAAAVADDRDLVPQHAVEVLDHRLARRFVARHAVPFGKALEDGRHLVRLRIRLAHPPWHHARARLREEVAPLRAAALDNVAREVEIILPSRQLVQAHERLQQRRRLNAVRAPPDLADVALRRGADLADEAVGLTLERGQHLRTPLHPFVVVLQRQHHVLPFPEVAAVRTRMAVAAGLQLLRHAADAAVRTLRREDVRHRAVQHRLQLGIAPVTVLHGARPHELTPHLAERELRPPLPEELRELAVRHVPLVPMRDALFNRHLQSARQRHGAGRKRLHHVPNSRLRQIHIGAPRTEAHFKHAFHAVQRRAALPEGNELRNTGKFRFKNKFGLHRVLGVVPHRNQTFAAAGKFAIPLHQHLGIARTDKSLRLPAGLVEAPEKRRGLLEQRPVAFTLTRRTEVALPTAVTGEILPADRHDAGIKAIEKMMFHVARDPLGGNRGGGRGPIAVLQHVRDGPVVGEEPFLAHSFVGIRLTRNQPFIAVLAVAPASRLRTEDVDERGVEPVAATGKHIAGNALAERMQPVPERLDERDLMLHRVRAGLRRLGIIHERLRHDGEVVRADIVEVLHVHVVEVHAVDGVQSPTLDDVEEVRGGAGRGEARIDVETPVVDHAVVPFQRERMRPVRLQRHRPEHELREVALRLEVAVSLLVRDRKPALQFGDAVLHRRHDAVVLVMVRGHLPGEDVRMHRHAQLAGTRALRLAAARDEIGETEVVHVLRQLRSAHPQIAAHSLLGRTVRDHGNLPRLRGVVFLRGRPKTPCAGKGEDEPVELRGCSDRPALQETKRPSTGEAVLRHDAMFKRGVVQCRTDRDALAVTRHGGKRIDADRNPRDVLEVMQKRILDDGTVVPPVLVPRPAGEIVLPLKRHVQRPRTGRHGRIRHVDRHLHHARVVLGERRLQSQGRLVAREYKRTVPGNLPALEGDLLAERRKRLLRERQGAAVVPLGLAVERRRQNRQHRMHALRNLHGHFFLVPFGGRLVAQPVDRNVVLGVRPALRGHDTCGDVLAFLVEQPQVHQTAALWTASGELQRVLRVRADGERLRGADAAGERGLALQPKPHETLAVLLPPLEELLRARRAILGIVGEINRIGLAVGIGNGP